MNHSRSNLQEPFASTFNRSKLPLNSSESPPHSHESLYCQIVWYPQSPGIVPGALFQLARSSGHVLANALESPVHVCHQLRLVYKIGYRVVVAWYVFTKSWIQATMAEVERPEQSPSRSSIPGSVIPSALQPPPCARK